MSPIAQTEISQHPSNDEVIEIVRDFAGDHRFALDAGHEPRGMLELHLQMFRDDLRVIVSKMRGEGLFVAAYPLCACEQGRRFGLDVAASETVSELEGLLSN